MAITECGTRRLSRLVSGWTGLPLWAFLIVTVIGLPLTGCRQGYKQKVVAAKEFTPLERARKILEGYASGEAVGSEFMGFELLREELRAKNSDPGGILEDAFSQIEKSIRRPAAVKAIAQRTLATLDKQAAPPQ
jgi:hypothetical protein